MRIKWDVVVGSILSGAVVASFTYFLQAPKDDSSLSLAYSSANIGAEFFKEYNKYLVTSISESLQDAKGIGVDESSTLGDLILEVANLYTASEFRTVENYIVRNNDSNREANFTLRGLDAGIVAWQTKSDGEIRVEEGIFEKSIKLQPSEQIEIKHYTRNTNSWSNDEAKNILIYVNGALLRDENQRTMLDDMFGRYMGAYPFLFFILIIFGAVTVILLILNFFYSVLQERQIQTVPEKSETETITKPQPGLEVALKSDEIRKN